MSLCSGLLCECEHQWVYLCSVWVDGFGKLSSSVLFSVFSLTWRHIKKQHQFPTEPSSDCHQESWMAHILSSTRLLRLCSFSTHVLFRDEGRESVRLWWSEMYSSQPCPYLHDRQQLPVMVTMTQFESFVFVIWISCDYLLHISPRYSVLISFFLPTKL